MEYYQPIESSGMKRRIKSETSLASYDSTMSDEDRVPERAAFCFGLHEQQPPCLQRETARLSSQQQQKIGNDLLGIEDDLSIKDVPLSSVQELHDEIRKLVQHESGNASDSGLASTTTSTSAFQLAMEIDSEYAFSQRLSLAFLRSVEGSTKRAAKRYLRHFTTKLDLFGRDKLCKDITLSDLDEYDVEALESGGFQVLEHNDRAGRPVLFGRYTCMKYRSVQNMVRALWYVWSSIVEDERHQKSGVVAIGYENGKAPIERFDNPTYMMNDSGATYYDLHSTLSDGGFDRDLARGILSLPLSLPIRPVGYHICADNSQWAGISDMVSVTVCKFVRLRLRFHYGTMQETMYKLMTNGIPVDSIPVTPEGDIDLTYHKLWIEKRKRLETERSQQQRNLL
jgi:hypothetical protein